MCRLRNAATDTTTDFLSDAATDFLSDTATNLLSGTATDFLSDTTTILGVISLSGSAMQQATVKAALARCTFPFERLKPGLQQAGISSVKISWQPMDGGSFGWASTAGEVAIKDSISGLQAQRTAILELGHIVDFFYMTPEMRKAIIRIWHPDIPDNHEWFGSTDYWSQNGESYSTLFLWAFTDEEMWFDAGYTHQPSKELASQLRAIFGSSD